jgi:hypothetical protein
VDKQIQIKWPRNKDGSILTFKKWARLNLSKDEYEKFLDAAENHQRAVVEAILKGDAVNRSTPSQVDIQWKDENTHKKIHVNDIRIQHQNLERHIRSSLELHQQKSL